MKLIRREFERWLAGQEPVATVGVAQAEHDCPIATFLKTKGAEDPRVERESWRPGPFTLFLPLPAWAEGFVAEVDAAHDTHEDVSAAAALLALGEAEECD